MRVLPLRLEGLTSVKEGTSLEPRNSCRQQDEGGKGAGQ